MSPTPEDKKSEEKKHQPSFSVVSLDGEPTRTIRPGDPEYDEYSAQFQNDRPRETDFQRFIRENEPIVTNRMNITLTPPFYIPGRIITRDMMLRELRNNRITREDFNNFIEEEKARDQRDYDEMIRVNPFANYTSEELERQMEIYGYSAGAIRYIDRLYARSL
jgi:hypothetical protein